MTKKGKKQYTYDYPEQRDLSKDLKPEDKKQIAELTGYSEIMIRLMCKGKRKMTEQVKSAVEKFVLLNNIMQETKSSIAI